MSLFSDDTTTVDILDDATTYHVTLRKLTEGDNQRYDDIAFRTQGVMPVGTLRQMALEKSIVSWDFPKEFSVERIKELTPEVAEAIHEEVQRFNPSMFPFAAIVSSATDTSSD